MAGSRHEITELLRAWSDGEPGALEKLVPLVYGELNRLAQYYMAQGRPGHTLQTTALVSEAYLRLVDSGEAYLAAQHGHGFEEGRRIFPSAYGDAYRLKHRTRLEAERRCGSAQSLFE